MALVTCTECGQMVSSLAAACPRCGHPVTREDLGESEERQARFKQCPRCAEQVLAAAVVCRHCRFDFERSGRGGCGPALLSLVVPGLGQVVRGEYVAAVVYFLLAVVLWAAFLGWVINIVSAFAAYHEERPQPRTG